MTHKKDTYRAAAGTTERWFPMNRTTNIPVGDALLGRVIDASGAPLDERGPIKAAAQLPLDRPADADLTPLPDQLLETGIKVIDLFAPIIRGGTSTITG